MIISIIDYVIDICGTDDQSNTYRLIKPCMREVMPEFYFVRVHQCRNLNGSSMFEKLHISGNIQARVEPIGKNKNFSIHLTVQLKCDE